MQRLVVFALLSFSTGCLFYDTTGVELREPSDAASRPDTNARLADARLVDSDSPDAATDLGGVDGGADASVTDTGDAVLDMASDASRDSGTDGGSDVGTDMADAGDDMAPPQFPPPGLQIWLSADDGVAVTMDKVDEWVDRSDGTRWITPQISRRPTLVGNVVNGRPILRFYGGQELRRENGHESLDAMHLFLVGERAASVMSEGAILATWDPGQGDTLIRFGTDPTALHFSSTTAGLAADFTVASTTNFQLFEVVADASTVEVRQDGITTATTSYTNTGPFRFSTIGQFRNNAFFRGDVAEVLVWNRKLDGAELATVRTYLQTRFFP